MKNTFSKFIFIFSLFVSFLAFPSVSYANHSWGSYHWARTANPFLVQLGDNVTSLWDSYLATASTDWTTSSVLDTAIVSGSTSAKRCRATSGRVEVCNATYGNNGWLGVAQIWITGEHITQGTVKMNDTYFSRAQYNTPAWRNLVMCQEVGHVFGLDHQDEVFDNPNLGTCMDYTNTPSTNQHPNYHDYQQLEIIYAQLDAFTTVGQRLQGSLNSDLHNRSEWGKQIRNNGQVAVFERDLGNEQKVVTHVIWAQE